jgi:hypothetical protein
MPYTFSLIILAMVRDPVPGLLNDFPKKDGTLA